MMTTTKGALLKKTTDRFVSDTTAGGFVRVRDNTGFRRLIWIVALFVFWICMLVQIHRVLVTFFEFNVATKVSMTSEASIPFPALTICNHNPIRASKAKWLIGEVGGDYQLLRSLFVPGDGPPNGTDPDEPQGKHSNALAVVMFNHPEEAAEAGHLYNESALSCHYHDWPCDSRDIVITRWSHGTYGNCYTLAINTTDDPEAADTTATGPQAGLSVAMYTQGSEYIPSISPVVGFRMEVHPFEYAPFPEDNGFTASGGTLVSVQLSKREIRRMSYPYSFCVPADEEDRHVSKNLYAPLDILQDNSTRKFSNKACTKSCLQSGYVRECGCAVADTINRELALMAFGDGVQPCNFGNRSTANCHKKNMHRRSIKESCIKQCTQPCKEVYYEIKTQVASFPSEKFLSYYWKRHMKQFPHMVQDMESDQRITAVFAELGFSPEQVSHAMRSVFKRDTPLGIEDTEDHSHELEENTPMGTSESLNGMGENEQTTNDTKGGIGKRYKQRILKEITQEFIANNLLRIEVYFEDLTIHAIIESVQMSFDDATSNIGGLLGLFAGMSFLTVVEICFFCKHAIGILCFNHEDTSPLKEVDEDDGKLKREFSVIRHAASDSNMTSECAGSYLPNDMINPSTDRSFAWMTPKIHHPLPIYT